MRKEFSFVAVNIRSELYDTVIIHPDGMVFDINGYGLFERDPSCFAGSVAVSQFMQKGKRFFQSDAPM